MLDCFLFVRALIFIFMLLYILLKSMVPAVYNTLALVSHYFSSAVGVIYSKKIDMGMTYAGVDTAVFFFISLAVTFAGHKCRDIKKIALAFGLSIFAWAAYIAFWTDMAENSLAWGLNLLEPLTGPLDFKALLFILLAAVYIGTTRKLTPSPEPAAKGRVIFLGAAGAFCAVSAMIYLKPMTAPASNVGAKIVIWDTMTDFSTPDYNNYGLDYTGMFGVLPEYLKKNGYRVEIVTEINKQTLDGAGVFVSFNTMEMPDDDALSALWDYTKAGGSVLLVGDHTGHVEIRQPINAILAPVGMEINFDSAVPFKSLWTDDFLWPRHEIYAGVSMRQIQLVVGASLKLPLTARPLLIGRAGYSDEGDLENMEDGYLGDMHFMRGERIGDLVLAAECKYGQGKFMVFADTSHFQNTVLAYSYPYIDNIFAYLADGAPAQTSGNPESAYKNDCIINMSHIENIGRDKTGHAADGLFSCAIRAGLMPYMSMEGDIAETFKNHPDASIIFFMEPAKAFKTHEIQALDAFMADGGTVVLTGSYDSPAATKELAAYYGFGFDHLPIGRVSPAKNTEMAFWNACPLEYNGQLLTGNGADGVKCLMDVWEYGVMAEKAVGDGQLFVIGDGEYFKNKNLEDTDSYRKGNADFTDYILKLSAKGPSGF